MGKDNRSKFKLAWNQQPPGLVGQTGPGLSVYFLPWQAFNPEMAHFVVFWLLLPSSRYGLQVECSIKVHMEGYVSWGGGDGAPKKVGPRG